MKYFLSSQRYLLSKNGVKKFLYFFLFSVLPAGLLAYGAPAYRLFFIVRDTEMGSFGTEWVYLFSAKLALLPILIGSLILVLASACLTSALTQHMKIGQFSLPRFFTSINNNFFPCFARAVTAAVFLLIAYTLFILFDVLWDSLLNSIAAIICSAFFFTILSIFTVYLFSAGCMWLPTMILTGQSLATALETAYSRSRDAHKRFFSFYCILLIIVVIFAAISYSLAAYRWAAWIVTTISYLIIFVLVHIFWFVAFFEENGISRADLTVSSYKRRL